MEDALVHVEKWPIERMEVVLILVVMEDALVHIFFKLNCMSKKSLNPCCNGRCTRTIDLSQAKLVTLVLILVVMEDALVPYRFPRVFSRGNLS